MGQTNPTLKPKMREKDREREREFLFFDLLIAEISPFYGIVKIGHHMIP